MISWIKRVLILFFDHFCIHSDKSIIQLIRNTQLFDHLRFKEFKKLCEDVKRTAFQPTEFIIKEGELGDVLYIIETGNVKVVTHDAAEKEIVLALLERGAYFGEQALLTSYPVERNASVIAITSVSVIEITHALFQQVLNTDDKLKTKLQRIGHRQLAEEVKFQVPILQFLPEQGLANLTGKMVNFSDQEIIFSQGDKLDFVYFILSGCVHIHIKNNDAPTVVVTYEPGQIFGELSVLTKKNRAGTAISQGPVKTFRVAADIFQNLYETVPAFREALIARQQLYKLPQFGTVSIKNSVVLEMSAVEINYQLPDGRMIKSTHVSNKLIFSMAERDTLPDQIICYAENNLRREIGLLNRRIISLNITGTWKEIGFICGMLIQKQLLMDWQINLFKNTGSFGTETLEATDPNKKICYCMNVTQNEISNKIKEGVNQLEQLMQVTGAGRVCGNCRPQLSEILGLTLWSFASISQVNALTPEVRLYRLNLQEVALPIAYQPGQYITVAAWIDKHWVQRSYTLTDCNISSRYYEIAIKKEDAGYFSNWLFKNDQHDPLIKVTLPQGEFIFNPKSSNPLVFFAAGIGITPAYAFAQWLRKIKNKKKIFFIHYSDHTTDDCLFLDAFHNIAQDYSNVIFKLHLTKELSRITDQDIASIINRYKTADFYVCGPNTYMEFIVSTLKSHGISAERIKTEIFTPI